MSAPKKLNHNKIIRLRKAGRSHQEIAKIMDTVPSVVHWHLRNDRLVKISLIDGICPHCKKDLTN